MLSERSGSVPSVTVMDTELNRFLRHGVPFRSGFSGVGSDDGGAGRLTPVTGDLDSGRAVAFAMAAQPPEEMPTGEMPTGEPPTR